MQYIGENLMPGRLGHLLIVLSFVASLLAFAAYVLATQKRAHASYEGWRNIGRFSFLLHGMAVLGIIGCLFFILVEKRYEYQYAWANVSDDLPFRYTFSAFWKEQQGSFLLWSFWHVALGLILMLRAGKWEAPVLAVMALAEAFIASMLLGLYFGDSRLGASPFDLLRDTMDAPIFSQADYLSKIKGNGLNPLLQNYWMTIHPPTLFLGFASTIVPFAYALAGLWTREYKDWVRPVLPWALFSTSILGLGILMGAAWAYEALSFGGFWAWDPVENTSLVPWLIMVAGVHTNLIARATGFSIRGTSGFYLLSFILVLYSTYLTRSGILGDTSAHAFTEMGLGLQLILFIVVFTLIAKLFWLINYFKMPARKEEESTTTREFWMFMGSLVLLFSSVLITGATSLPVWNKVVQLFNPDYIGAALRDPVDHHNRYQLWIAVFIAVLSAIGQYMRYGERNWSVYFKKFLTHILIASVGTLLIAIPTVLWLGKQAWQYVALATAAAFAVAANLDYIITFIRGNIKQSASAMAHLGFGLLVFGILATGLKREYISSNRFAMEGLIEIEGADGQAMDRNVLLMKEAPMPMRAGYEATYISDTLVRQTRTFQVNFRKLDEQGNPTGHAFELHPNVMYDRGLDKVVASNPSTQHYWDRDIFTHIASLPKADVDPEFAKQQEDSLNYIRHQGAPGDTIQLDDYIVVVEDLSRRPTHPDYKPQRGDLALGVVLAVYDKETGKRYSAQPMLYIRPNQGGFTLPVQLGPQQLKFRLSEQTIEKIFKMEEALRYSTFLARKGESFSFQGYTIQFEDVATGPQAQHSNYDAEPGDIAVKAQMRIQAPDGRTATTGPILVIRDNQPYTLKDEAVLFGMHVRLDKLDPKTGQFTFSVAQASPEQRRLLIDIAEHVLRSDYIVLEAIMFPGINLVWIGSLLMVIASALAAWRRLVQHTA